MTRPSAQVSERLTRPSRRADHFDLDRSDALQRARKLMSQAGEMQAVLFNPELDPAFARKVKHDAAQQRTQVMRHDKELRTEAKYQRKSLRADRLRQAKERDRQRQVEELSFKNNLRHAQVAVRRQLESGPVKLSDKARIDEATARRQRMAQQQPAGEAGRGGQAGVGRGHDKSGDEVLARARRLCQQANAR
uniref:Uncharacterized protein n=1 Tax=Rhizochromulina marina TaxID=1034831 RepID=A0A7S2WIT3_9STRA|mmetsp:Transcript_25009/g.73093  ORF Transcript_25009/g.73093 Transcript_25009/m.73093 type:complete len:192 (+) Transcript_25009:116-691(+)